MKRVCISVLVIALITGIFSSCGNSKTKLKPSNTNASVTGKTFKKDDFKYKEVEGGIEITKYLNNLNAYPTIPSKIKGQKVVSIGENVFSKTQIESVKLGKYIKTIKKRAFYMCDNLSEIKLPDSVEEIGVETFAESEILEIKFGKNCHIKKVGKGAFSGLDLTEFPCTDTVESIGDYAFARTGIEMFTIGKNLKHLGEGVFTESYLKYIDVDEKNKYFTYKDDVLYNKDKTRLILYKKTGGSFTPPDSVTEISAYAFESAGLYNINLNNNIKKIGEGAFSDCDNLKSIKLPDSITEIADLTFRNCESLKTVKLSNKITKIGQSAFESSGIKSLTLSNSVKRISGYAFSSSKIKTINLNSNLESIGEEAFSQTKIEEIALPKSLKNVHKKAFYDMKKLKAIKVNADNKSFSDINGVLYNKDKTELINYPFGLKPENFYLGENTKRIAECAFYSHPHIKNVFFNPKLETVGKEAFTQAEKLNSVYLNGGLKNIDKRAFWECEKLETYAIPNNIEKIGDDAFSETGIKSLVINAPNLKLGSSVFAGCKKLEKLTLLNLKSSEGFTFSFNEKLKDVVFGVDYKIIYESDFTYDDLLSGITIPKSIKSIGKFAFGYFYGEDEGPYDDEDLYRRDDYVIKGYKGTAAEKYAKENGFKFVALG